MKSIIDMNYYRIFFRNIFPSVFSMIILSFYIICDTAFIGKGIGSHALAALNICLPFFNLIFGIGLLSGIGGSIMYSINYSSGKKNEAYNYFYLTVLTGILFTGILSLTLFSLRTKVINMLGSNSDLFELCDQYLKYVIPFSVFFVSNSILAAFLRNFNAPNIAMMSLCSGGILNIILDYYYIFIAKQGMAGAAFATGIGSIFPTLFMTLYILFKNRIPLKYLKMVNPAKKIKNIIRTGIPSFVIELSSGVIIYLFNYQLLKTGGINSVSAYSIIANTSLVCSAIFTGVTNGIQPIFSSCWGSEKFREISQYLKTSLIFSLFTGIFFYTIILLKRNWLIDIFTKDPEKIRDITVNGIMLYFSALIFSGINMIISTYFQSIEKTVFSNIITFSRCIFFIAVYIFILPVYFGINGIWITVTATEISTLLIIIIIRFLKKAQ